MNPPKSPVVPDIPTPEERGGVLGFALVCLVALLAVAAFRAPSTTRDVVVGVSLIVWGLLFIAAYFFSHKTFFLRGLMWLCVRMSCPATPKMAFFYGFMGLLMGTVALLNGLGLIGA